MVCVTVWNVYYLKGTTADNRIRNPITRYAQPWQMFAYPSLSVISLFELFPHIDYSTRISEIDCQKLIVYYSITHKIETLQQSFFDRS